MPTTLRLSIAAALALSIAGAVFAGGLPQRVTPPRPPAGELLVVKFAEGSEVRLRGGGLKSLAGDSLAGFEKALAAWPGATVSRVFSRPEAELEAEQARLKAAGRSEAKDLNLFYHLRLPHGVDAEEAIARLGELPAIDVVYRAPRGLPAILVNLESQQDYLEAPPGGIGAGSVWPLPATGAGVTIADVEACWNTSHEDLAKATDDRIVIESGRSISCRPQSPFWEDEHGTAVAGELVADRNGFGVTGIAYGADILLAPIRTCDSILGLCVGPDVENVADAISRAAGSMQPGDVILIEWQLPGPNYTPMSGCAGNQFGLVAVEWYAAEYEAIRNASDLGVVVVEAAGNGAQDFDDVVYEGLFDRAQRDSGAIVVGAGAASGGSGPARSRLCFSNHGSRVDVQGWGEKVVTTGYGDHAASDSSKNGFYTQTFAGTSSASPLVAGAVALVQGHRKAQGKAVLTPQQMRELLAGTGVRQVGTDGNIGPQVDVAAAIRTLDTPPAIAGVSVDSTLGCQGSPARRWITLNGAGFVLASRVVLNDGTTDHEILAERTEYLESPAPPRLRVCADVSQASQWTVRVKNLTYQTSSPFAFRASGGADFWTLTPCRLLDTRNAAGPYGGPVLASGAERRFALAGRCGIPASATALSANVTVVLPSGQGHVSAYPPDTGTATTSVLNFGPGQVRANNAILPVAADGAATIALRPFVAGGGTVHLLLDVNGFFELPDTGETVRVLSQGAPGAPGKDIWTTSVFAYDGVALTPGGGKDDERLLVGGWADQYHGLLQFDLAGMPRQVASARLELYSLTSRSGITNLLYLDRLTGDWDWRLQGTGRDRQRLWWADRPAGVLWHGGALPAPEQGAWYVLDVTALYQAWKSGDLPNYGLRLRPVSTDNRWSEFASSQHPDPALRPRLVVELEP